MSASVYRLVAAAEGHLRRHNIGATRTDLARLLGYQSSYVNELTSWAKEQGLLREESGRLYPARETVNVPLMPALTFRLSPDELERVRRGEPSTGGEPRLATLSVAALAVHPQDVPRAAGLRRPPPSWAPLPPEFQAGSAPAVAKRRRRRTDRDRIADLLRQGMRIAHVARLAGCSKATVRAVRRKTGLPSPPPGRPYTRPRPGPEVADMLRQGYRIAQVAAITGCSYTVINKVLVSLGLPSPPRGRPRLTEQRSAAG